MWPFALFEKISDADDHSMYVERAHDHSVYVERAHDLLSAGQAEVLTEGTAVDMACLYEELSIFFII